MKHLLDSAVLLLLLFIVAQVQGHDEDKCKDKDKVKTKTKTKTVTVTIPPRTKTVTHTSTVSTCPSSSPCTTSPNPIINPGFEAATLAPWSIYRYLDVSPTVPTDDPGNAHSGSQYWKFQFFSPGGYAFPTQTAVPLPPPPAAAATPSYVLSMYAKIDPVPPADLSCTILIDASKMPPSFDILGTSGSLQLNESFAEYTQVSTGPFAITDPSVTKVNVGISLDCDASVERTISLDDVVLANVCPSS